MKLHKCKDLGMFILKEGLFLSVGAIYLDTKQAMKLLGGVLLRFLLLPVHPIMWGVAYLHRCYQKNKESK